MRPAAPFAPRCPLVIELCRQERPPLVEVGSGHTAACHRSDAL